ncbi:hypothetical protein HFD88_002913 [Aspergillus terreus]|nr:hypothetical protein HFD88_002913 [Aspergillus terreus]
MRCLAVVIVSVQSIDRLSAVLIPTQPDDWQATFHSIPKAIDRLVHQRVGTRLCEIGTADAANSDMFTDFDSWGESVFWPSVMSKFGVQVNGTAKEASGLEIQIRPGMRASALGLRLQEGQVLENRLLTAPSVPEKRMLRFKLPPDMTYQCGDYLAILPVNPPNVVRWAIRRFNLSWDSTLTVWKPTDASGSIAVPLETPISALELFSTYVELSQPASKWDLKYLADAAHGDTSVQNELRSLASDATRFVDEIVQQRVSPLDILLRHPVIDLPLNTFLTMLPPMRVRQYSISSSPLVDPSECSIKFSVLKSPSPSTSSRDSGFEGVASTYLAGLQPGEKAYMTVRPSTFGFKPPLDLQTPMIMACAGSGLAPFRGFIMDRAEKIRGRQLTGAPHPDIRGLAKAILYVGCRTKGVDDIHAEELAEWVRLGAVDVRWVYSRPAGDSLSGSSPHEGSDGADGSRWRRHVQDQIVHDREELAALLERGARILVCGGTGVGQGVRQALKRIYLRQRRDGCRLRIDTDEGDPSRTADDEDAAAERFLEMLKTKERYATDVFT